MANFLIFNSWKKVEKKLNKLEEKKTCLPNDGVSLMKSFSLVETTTELHSTYAKGELAAKLNGLQKLAGIYTSVAKLSRSAANVDGRI